MAKNKNIKRLDNGMFYTDEDLLILYTNSKNKKEQIHILAELNLCEDDEMEMYLFKIGSPNQNLKNRLNDKRNYLLGTIDELETKIAKLREDLSDCDGQIKFFQFDAR